MTGEFSDQQVLDAVESIVADWQDDDLGGDLAVHLIRDLCALRDGPFPWAGRRRRVARAVRARARQVQRVAS